MAKKKTSNAQGEKPLAKQEDSVKSEQQVTPPMDSEASEKIDRLKTLNQTLLKEAVERRRQVESLEKSKGNLEMELARSKVERNELKSEVNRLGERVWRMEVESGVVADYVAVHVGWEMEGLEVEMMGLRSEIRRLRGKLSEVEGLLGNEKEVLGRVCMERDGLRDELSLQIEEIKRLGEALSGLKEGKVQMEGRIEELQAAYNGIVEEKEELEMRFEVIMKEKDLTVRGLEEVGRLKEELSVELRRVVREKEVVEVERDGEMVKREDLEGVVSGLSETVAGLHKEEEKLRMSVGELERRMCEGEDREKELRREMDQLMEEKELSERKVEGLLVEKSVVEKDLEEAMEQMDEQKRKVEELVNEKIVTGEAKSRLDDEVGLLRIQVSELKAVVARLEECNSVEAEKFKRLESEVREYRCKLQAVQLKRDELENRVREEKESSVVLKGVIEDLENKVEESLEAAGKANAENAAILAAKGNLESECEMLKKKIVSLESAVTEARKEFDSMKGKAQLADAKSEHLLNMLKETVAFCSKDESSLADGHSDGDKHVDAEEAKAYLVDLEMIKNAFKSKVSKVENMRRELEFLQSSVEEAHKKKGFWTMLSSATTVLAAVSIAYVARGH